MSAAGQERSLVHPTYRHLERAVRLAGLTLWQWAALVGGGLGAWALVGVLPFSARWDLGIALTITGTPLAVWLATDQTTVSPLRYLLALRGWQRVAALYLPGGPSRPPAGYRLTDRPPAIVASPGDPARRVLDVEALWD